MADTLVFIPAWNEEDNLAGVLDELRPELPDVDVLVVDDGSTDRTPQSRASRALEVLSFGENRGLRAGIAAGYGYAREHGYELCGRVDADGQHPVEELRKPDRRSSPRRMRRGSRLPVRHAATASPAYRYSLRLRGGWEPGCFAGSMSVALDRPFHDATSGMYAVARWRCRSLRRRTERRARGGGPAPRSTTRACAWTSCRSTCASARSGESKLRGKKALKLVVTGGRRRPRRLAAQETPLTLTSL